MHILHTESSEGWGGQEIRILKEAEGMRERGHEVVMAVSCGGGLVKKAREMGFTVYELSFKKKHALKAIPLLVKIMRKHKIELVNTHSSLDSWVGGVSARLAKVKVIRTRHLSAAIKKGLNSRLLYNTLADYVVTTSSCIIPMICKQARRSEHTCQCIPTGVDPQIVQTNKEDIANFRKYIRAEADDVVVGTACFVRSWKGIFDFMSAALALKDEPKLKWVIVGGGHVRDYQKAAHEMGLDDVLTFTGHIDSPFAAIAAMDIFALLSTANEGVSQASLQAAYLGRPLITTPIGGLPEVCIDGQTGIIVPTFSSEKFAAAVLRLKNNPALRQEFGAKARQHVEDKFLISQMLDQMEAVYAKM
jgi:glycosyltransferase involved in cell wall biosynthesis